MLLFYYALFSAYIHLSKSIIYYNIITLLNIYKI